MALPKVNAVIVGAGAGGGIVAKELAEAGLRVVVLERGKWYTPFDCRKDSLRNQRTTALGNAFGPDDERHPRVAVDSRGRERIVRASESAYQNNAACVGGGTFSYGAMAWRFMEKDLRMRSTYGAPEGSTLEDWPISYDDLEPYYEEAEWEIGVAGDDSNNPFRAPRKKPLPMPPLSPTREYEILKPAAQRLGLHPFDYPMLRNTVPYNGRPACMRCRWCVGFACEVDAKCGTHNTVLPKALATKNCDLRTECIAKEILTDSQGRVRGVSHFDSHDRLQEQPADLVVVSCAAICTRSSRPLRSRCPCSVTRGTTGAVQLISVQPNTGPPPASAAGISKEAICLDLGSRDAPFSLKYARQPRHCSAEPAWSVLVKRRTVSERLPRWLRKKRKPAERRRSLNPVAISRSFARQTCLFAAADQPALPLP
jgi:choline dehydrogenase-like flavoprotein